jgi:EAL domain-containing protein (putative c-di-GMP-specific phosphodiesterase class I)
LIAAVAEPFVIDAQPYHLSVSVGMSAAPDDGTDPALLLRSAYAALSTAKHSTRNAFCWYSEEMSADAASSGRLRNELRAAIESGELVLHYQPIVDVARDRIVAVEALVRWNHPRRGLLGPADFIELADRTGLIMPLGEWVLREACRQGREWCRLGFDLHVSVNVSAVQFRQPNFVARVAAILAQSGLRPDLLELELTESVMVDGVDEMIETLGRLKVLGLRLAIDDFGTGYSSLAYLKHFPVNTLKIDRAFVTNIARDGFDRAIATAVAALAAELHFDYVVEGVETTEQLEILRDIGCTMMQGYYFARPVPPGEIDVMLDKPLLAGRPNR